MKKNRSGSSDSHGDRMKEYVRVEESTVITEDDDEPAMNAHHHMDN